MAYFVYILQSEKSGRFYIGSSDDPSRRLSEHNRGKAPATRGRGPWEIVYREEFPTRSDAVKQEMNFKRKKSVESIKRILGEGG